MKWIKDNPEKYKVIKDKINMEPKNREKRRLYEIKRRGSGKRKEWEQENKDKLRGYGKNRSMNKKHEITENEWISCKNYFDDSCAYCGLHESEHYRLWYGEMKQFDLHKEHVNHNGSNKLDNCVPSCQKCNSSKWEYSLDEWYSEDNPKFSQERLDKIHKWLNEDYKKYKK